MLDDILKTRYVPEPPTNLAYRIIEAAKPRGQEKSLIGREISWAGIRRAFAELFVIPQPAFAMAVILLAGLALGTNFTAERFMNAKMERTTISNFISAENNFDYGDFL